MKACQLYNGNVEIVVTSINGWWIQVRIIFHTHLQLKLQSYIPKNINTTVGC